MRFDLAIECITKNYASFKGRASRSEYWSYIIIAALPSYLLLFYVGGWIDSNPDSDSFQATIGVLFTLIIFLVLFLPTLAVTVRRLHDLNRSGWWVLLTMIPGVYLLLLIAFLFKGSAGENKYGPELG